MSIRTVNCEHATPSEKQGTIICAVGKFSGRPHIGTCWYCLAGGIEPPLPEDPCAFRGEVTKTVPCCKGKTRAVAYACYAPETVDEIGAQMCNSRACRFYAAPELVSA